MHRALPQYSNSAMAKGSLRDVSPALVGYLSSGQPSLSVLNCGPSSQQVVTRREWGFLQACGAISLRVFARHAPPARTHMQALCHASPLEESNSLAACCGYFFGQAHFLCPTLSCLFCPLKTTFGAGAPCSPMPLFCLSVLYFSFPCASFSLRLPLLSTPAEINLLSCRNLGYGPEEPRLDSKARPRLR